MFELFIMYSHTESQSNVSDTSPTRSKNANFNASVLFSKLDPFAYIILKSDGRVFAANNLENPNISIPFLPNATDTKKRFAYLVFKGSQGDTDSGPTEPMQIIIMRRMFKMSVGSEHSYIRKAAIEMYDIESILHECYNITLDENNSIYYFSGEGFFDINIVNGCVSVLEGKQLEGVKFDTRGTACDKFRKQDVNGMVPELVSFIPESCMDFHEGHDDIIKVNISTPERRKTIASAESTNNTGQQLQADDLDNSLLSYSDFQSITSNKGTSTEESIENNLVNFSSVDEGGDSDVETLKPPAANYTFIGNSLENVSSNFTTNSANESGDENFVALYSQAIPSNRVVSTKHSLENGSELELHSESSTNSYEDGNEDFKTTDKSHFKKRKSNKEEDIIPHRANVKGSKEIKNTNSISNHSIFHQKDITNSDAPNLLPIPDSGF
ncbi:hypothetical protein ACNVED_08295 [Legionella sp. D16C41]|uniref:hypothetical protein n=1 Tax=Legionella sp. D16C41 TaxID=3402688 RepID=UPI003AF99894